MKKFGYPAVALFLTLAVGLAPWRAGAADEERPIRLYATAHAGPIGMVAGGSAAIVNGRATQGEQLIWGGELLRAPAGSSLRISFDSVGYVTLARGAAARFAVAHGGGNETGRRVLVASVVYGSLAVRLQSDAGAYVEAGGMAYTANQGADFRVGLEGGEPVLNTISGTVHAAQQPAQRQYVLRPVGLGSSISVRARATRQIQIQVTDENDRPQTDVPVVFQLGGSTGDLGTLGAAPGLTTTTVRTDSRGIATVPYTAGPVATTGQITATVEGTNFSWTGQISVTGGGGFWNVRNTAITAAAVAAGMGAGLVFTKKGNNNGELTPVPPPIVRP